MIEAEENLPKAQRGRDHPVSEFIRLIGQRFAIESLSETCKANRVEPYSYLVELFKVLPLAKTGNDYEALLPWRLIPSAD